METSGSTQTLSAAVLVSALTMPFQKLQSAPTATRNPGSAGRSAPNNLWSIAFNSGDPDAYRYDLQKSIREDKRDYRNKELLLKLFVDLNAPSRAW